MELFDRARASMTREQWQDWVVLGAAAWLFIAPRILGFDPAAHTPAWVTLVASLLLFYTSILALFRPNAWGETAEFLIGIMLLFSPWLAGYDDDFIPASNAILVGFMIAVITGSTFVRDLEVRAGRHDWAAGA